MQASVHFHFVWWHYPALGQVLGAKRLRAGENRGKGGDPKVLEGGGKTPPLSHALIRKVSLPRL